MQCDKEINLLRAQGEGTFHDGVARKVVLAL